MIRLRLLAAVAAMLLAFSAPVSAQDAATGLPGVAAQPRTLRAYTHVFVAFGVAWVLLFGYTVSVGRRFGKLEEELNRLKG
jgi:CcmD family protein